MQEVIFIKHSCRMNRKLELVAKNFFWMSVAGFYCPIRQPLESKPSRILIFLSRCFLFSRDVCWEFTSKHLISLETRSFGKGTSDYLFFSRKWDDFCWKHQKIKFTFQWWFTLLFARVNTRYARRSFFSCCRS